MKPFIHFNLTIPIYSNVPPCYKILIIVYKSGYYNLPLKNNILVIII